MISFMRTLINPIDDFLSYSIIIEIHSLSKFAIAALLGILTCTVYTLIFFEINEIEKRFNYVNKTRWELQNSLNDPDNYVNPSTSDLGIQVIFENNGVRLIKPIGDLERKIDHLLSLSPDEYVKRELTEYNTTEMGDSITNGEI